MRTEANIAGNEAVKSTEGVPLPTLIKFLVRSRPAHAAPHLISTLIEQCKNFDRNPDAMRPKILRTIEAIENAA